MTITEQPRPIDFVDNNPKIKLKIQTNHGAKSTTTYQFERLTAGTLYVRTQYNNIAWQVVQAAPSQNQLLATDNPDDLVKELEKIKLNYKLRAHYKITVAKAIQNVVLKFETLKNESANNIVVITSSANTQSGIVGRTNTVGAEDDLKRMRTKYKFLIERDWPEGSVISTESPYEEIETPEFVTESNEEYIEIGTSILKPYLEERNDLPGYETYKAMRSNSLKYKLIAQTEDVENTTQGESFLQNEPVIFLPMQNNITDFRRKITYEEAGGFVSKKMEIVNGIIEKSRYINNFADWDLEIMGAISEQTDIIIWGQENNITKKIYEPIDWLYVRNPTDNNIPVTLTIKYTTTNNTEEITQQLQIYAQRLMQFRILPANTAIQLEMQDIALKKIEVKVESENETVKRKYIFIPKPFNAKTLYLKNRLNLYETFYIESSAKEVETNAEEVMIDETWQYVGHAKKEIYIARTGYRNPKELKLLEAAVDKKYNYIVENGKRVEIHILPETIRTVDENEDMLETEFKYIKGRIL